MLRRRLQSKLLREPGRRAPGPLGRPPRQRQLRVGGAACPQQQVPRGLLARARPGVQPDALRPRGHGEPKGASVLAVLELVRRLLEPQVPEKAPLSVRNGGHPNRPRHFR